MKYEYDKKQPTKWEMGAALAGVLFITFGLYVIGIAWGVNEIENNVERIPTPPGTIIIEGATLEDLKLQTTVPGTDLQGSTPCLQGTCDEL